MQTIAEKRSSRSYRTVRTGFGPLKREYRSLRNLVEAIRMAKKLAHQAPVSVASTQSSRKPRIGHMLYCKSQTNISCDGRDYLVHRSPEIERTFT